MRTLMIGGAMLLLLVCLAYGLLTLTSGADLSFWFLVIVGLLVGGFILLAALAWVLVLILQGKLTWKRALTVAGSLVMAALAAYGIWWGVTWLIDYVPHVTARAPALPAPATGPAVVGLDWLPWALLICLLIGGIGWALVSAGHARGKLTESLAVTLSVAVLALLAVFIIAWGDLTEPVSWVGHSPSAREIGMWSALHGFPLFLLAACFVVIIHLLAERKTAGKLMWLPIGAWLLLLWLGTWAWHTQGPPGVQAAAAQLPPGQHQVVVPAYGQSVSISVPVGQKLDPVMMPGGVTFVVVFTDGTTCIAWQTCPKDGPHHYKNGDIQYVYLKNEEGRAAIVQYRFVPLS